MAEHSFDYDPAIPPGRAIFVAHNVGQADHQVTMAPIPDDFPPLDDQLRGSERRILPQFVTTPDIGPGQTWTFAVDLLPGTRYAILCFARDANGTVHALQGMASEFRTPSLPGEAPAGAEPTPATSEPTTAAPPTTATTVAR